MVENNRRGRVRERLAYSFAATLIGAVAAYIIGKCFGIDIEVPAVITTTMGNILIFYFGTKAGSEKPES